MTISKARVLSHRVAASRWLVAAALLAAVMTLGAGMADPAAAGGTVERHRVDWEGAGVLRPAIDDPWAPTVLGYGVAVPGEPWPGRVVRLEIPPAMRVTGVELHSHRETVLSVPPRPSPRSIDLGQPTGRSGGYAYWILPEGDYRGYRIAQIMVVPFRYDGEELRFLADFEVELVLAPGETAALRRQIASPATVAADESALRAVLDASPRFYPAPAGQRVPTVPPELSAEPVEYLIITTDELAPGWAEYTSRKSREGTPAVVTTVEWILANYEGSDLPARVRSYIRDVYLYQGLQYVLLGGDTPQIPTRLATARYLATQGVQISTDRYYGCLDGDWNADGDDEIGEAPDIFMGYEGDLVDLYPEVSVGRAPVADGTEVERYVAKWKSYTGYDGLNFRTDYQTRMLSLGEVLSPSNWVPGQPESLIIVDGADLCESTLVYVPSGFTKTRMYEYSSNPAHPGAIPETRDSVIARINQGYGIIDHVGHGFRTNMSVGDGKIVNLDADQLTNSNAFSLLYAINCASGAIRYDCIVEHLLINPNGGVVAAVAATDLDYPLTSEHFKHEFFRLLFEENVTRMGDTFSQADLPWIPLAQVSENSYRWTYMTLIAIGDPTLEIWRETPKTMDLVHSPNMLLGAGSFIVAAFRNSFPVANVKITLWKDGDDYGVATTDASGLAFVPFFPDTTGTFAITGIKNGFVPAVSTGNVIPAQTATLYSTYHRVHDGDGVGGTGDGNGRPDAGEDVLVDVVIKNGGSVTATGIQATLHTHSSFLAVSDSVVTTGNLAPGQVDTLHSAFAYSVTTDLPDTLRHVVVPAVLELHSNQATLNEPFPFSVYQRLIDLIALDWTIPDDDGDTVLESGESVDIDLTLENGGEADAIGVVATIAYGGSAFTVLDDTIDYGVITAGSQETGGSFTLISVGGGQGDLQADLTVSDTHGTILFTRQLDIVAPGVATGMERTATSSRIRLTWIPPADTDLRGYRVYRSADGLGFIPLMDGIIDDGSFYADEGLPPLTVYWYRVAAVDSAGNEGGWSIALKAGTSPPVLEGWPVPLPSGESKGSPTFFGLDPDEELEIVLGWKQPMVFSADGGDFVDGDQNALTPGVFADLEDGDSQFWNSPAVADLDQDQVFELVFCAWQTTGTGHIYVLDQTGAIEPGWPQELGIFPWSTPAVGDVDGDGNLEIFVSSGSGAGTYRGVLFGFNHDGTEIMDGDSNPATHGIFYQSASTQARFMYGSPAMANLDGDPEDEIIFLEKTSTIAPHASSLYVFNGDGSVLPGFPYGVGVLKASTSSPAVADLDGNGDLEIVGVTENAIFVVNHDGTDFNGWPQALPAVSTSATEIRDYMSSPAIGDVNGDGSLDIALGWLSGGLYLWTANGGAAHPGFPVPLDNSGTDFERYLRSPIIGNVDLDPNPEILVSSGKAELHAVKANGQEVPGFPMAIAGSGVVYGSPALWDIDADGFVNLVVQSNAPLLEVYSFTSVAFNPAQHPWPMFRHDHRKSGYRGQSITIGVGEGAAVVPGVASVFPARPNPFFPKVDLPFRVPAQGGRVEIRVFDVGGREVRRLAEGDFPAGDFRISWDGRTEMGSRLSPGVYFARIGIGNARFVQKLVLMQ